MSIIDSHCHLEYPGLTERREEVLANARGAGISGMLNISTQQSEWDAVRASADSADDIWASVGVHPHHADAHQGLSLDTLMAACEHPKVIGIGETGLDYYYDKSDRAVQRALFTLHIAAARQLGLPLIIHTRDAEEDTLAILSEEMAAGAFPALIHCFTASADFAEAVLQLGLTISFSGIATFKSARELQDVARSVPAGRILVETDAPFLAPVPHRGQTCEPAFTADTLRFLAELRGDDPAALAAQTTRNFFALFSKASPVSGESTAAAGAGA